MTDTHIINSDQSIESIHSLYSGRQSIIKHLVNYKKCILCDEQINIDDYAEHVVSCLEPQNSLPDASVPLIEQSVVYNEPNDDDPEHVVSYLEPQNSLPDASVPLIEQSVVYNEPIDDDPEHTSSCNESDNIFLPSVVYNEPNDDSTLLSQPVTDDDDGYATPEEELPVTVSPFFRINY